MFFINILFTNDLHRIDLPTQGTSNQHFVIHRPIKNHPKMKDEAVFIFMLLE
jgi:hypothetical protein